MIPKFMRNVKGEKSESYENLTQLLPIPPLFPLPSQGRGNSDSICSWQAALPLANYKLRCSPLSLFVGEGDAAWLR
jgi:hypothetical protein